MRLAIVAVLLCAFVALGPSEAAPAGLLDAAQAGAAQAAKELRHEQSVRKIRSAAQSAAMASACEEEKLNAREKASNKLALQTRASTVARALAKLKQTSMEAKLVRAKANGKAIQSHADSSRTIMQDDAAAKVTLARDKAEQLNACAREFVDARASARSKELTVYKKAEGDAKRASHNAETAAKEALRDAKTNLRARDGKILQSFRKALRKAQEETTKKKAEAVQRKASCVKACAAKQPKDKKATAADTAFEACTSACGSVERKSMLRAGLFEKKERIKAEENKRNARKESAKVLADKQAELQKKKETALLKVTGTQNGIKTAATTARSDAYSAAKIAHQKCADKAASTYAAALKTQAAKHQKRLAAVARARDKSLSTHNSDFEHKMTIAAGRFKHSKTAAERRFRKQTVAAARDKANALATNPACAGRR